MSTMKTIVDIVNFNWVYFKKELQIWGRKPGFILLMTIVSLTIKPKIEQFLTS